MKGKKIVFGFLLLVFVVGSGFGFWSLGESHFKRRYGEMDVEQVGAAQSKEFFIYCPVRGWRGNPGISMRHNSGAWVTHNEAGCRDTPWDLDTAKPRVLLLGDSNMWGYGVNDDEYPAALLNRDHPDIRWFNAGMNGYGTDQQYLAFIELAPRIKPDLTVLVFCGNDRFENTSRRVRGYNKPYFSWDGETLTHHNNPVPEPAKTDALWFSMPDEIFRRTGSYILYHVAQVVEARKNRARAAESGLDREIRGSSALDPTEALVRALNQAAAGRLLVVSIPTDEDLFALCRAEDIPYVDMGASPARQPGPHTYPGGRPKYGHWTPEGNRVAAGIIAEAVLARLAPGSPHEAAPAEPHVWVVNQTGTELMEVRWIDADGKDWGEGSLRADYLEQGARAALVLPAGVEGSIFTIRAVDPDGKDLEWPAQVVTNGQAVILERP
ncbi:MAG: SGNH/GDSL hydrolase family protein [Candidatus Marinimicrobia bacterium]|nr:SGNH/GDSL hydrolase family protein [Candidatus Neomarinimicrobiota bacterium]